MGRAGNRAHVSPCSQAWLGDGVGGERKGESLLELRCWAKVVLAIPAELGGLLPTEGGSSGSGEGEALEEAALGSVRGQLCAPFLLAMTGALVSSSGK